MANNAPHLHLRSSRKDEVFARDDQQVGDFAFNATVADVFDDMVGRSVAHDFAQPDTNLYDIGCSTATTLLTLDGVIEPSVRFIGIDNAPDMLDKARQKIDASAPRRQIDLKVADLHQGVDMDNASVVTMLLTL
ncbi:methyltransferase domain-containing protein [Ensifer sp. 4252]|uniref:methyltransferase domain-containing protein n=1 Tax=Ensifer sp. 4252 TaxID=3373915 RepID=UPI003D1AABBE